MSMDVLLVLEGIPPRTRCRARIGASSHGLKGAPHGEGAGRRLHGKFPRSRRELASSHVGDDHRSACARFQECAREETQRDKRLRTYREEGLTARGSVHIDGHVDHVRILDNLTPRSRSDARSRTWPLPRRTLSFEERWPGNARPTPSGRLRFAQSENRVQNCYLFIRFIFVTVELFVSINEE